MGTARHTGGIGGGAAGGGRRVGVALVLLWALAGCAAGSDGEGSGGDAAAGEVDGGAEGPPQAQVGGASDEGKGFVDWSAGDFAAPIIRGPQGGQHIWVSAHARHVFPNKARVAVTMYLGSGAQAKVVSPGRVEMIGNLKGDGDWLIYPGIAAFVKEPCKIYGQSVRVELEVDDLYGRRASDHKWIRPTWDGPCD